MVPFPLPALLVCIQLKVVLAIQPHPLLVIMVILPEVEPEPGFVLEELSEYEQERLD